MRKYAKIIHNFVAVDDVFMKGKINVFWNPFCAPLLRRWFFRLVLQCSIPCSNARFSFLYLLVMLLQLELMDSGFIWGRKVILLEDFAQFRAVFAFSGKKKKKNDVLGIILDTGMKTLFV